MSTAVFPQGCPLTGCVITGQLTLSGERLTRLNALAEMETAFEDRASPKVKNSKEKISQKSVIAN